jgi:pimeloyl-ACP methyl ester carboxylesterase
MANVKANGIQIEYETLGDKSGRPILLIMGFSCQLNHWSDEFCQQLVDSGHYVIRFDNRDTGLSTKFTKTGLTDVSQALSAAMRGEEIKAFYTFDDMADDAVGLLEALDIERAHICGISMGGAIAQTIAMRHPSSTLSLVSIYAPVGDPALPPPKPEIFQILMTPPPAGRKAYIENYLRVSRTFSGSGYKLEEKYIRDLAGRVYDRSYFPEGAARQFVAALASGNRIPALRTVTVPTLVIHGDEDPVVSIENGKAVADAVPGAKLMIIKGMGHDVPYRGAWPQIAAAIAEHTKNVRG